MAIFIIKNVRVDGLVPSASRLSVGCSNHLSYTRERLWNIAKKIITDK